MNIDILSAFVALLALLFSVGSFWWIHARKGSLVSYPVITFSGLIDASELQIRIPVVIYNTGAAPSVIRAMKLTYVGVDKKVHTLQSQTFLKTIDPKDSHSDFVHAFAIPGRTVITKHVKFVEASAPSTAPGKETLFVLQVLRDENAGWTGLRAIRIHTGLLIDRLITMSNDPAHWNVDTLSNGTNYQLALIGETP